jgi:hypothetical protein
MSATAKKFTRAVASKRYVRASVKDKFAHEYDGLGLDEEPTTVELKAAKAYFDAKDKYNLYWAEYYKLCALEGHPIK